MSRAWRWVVNGMTVVSLLLCVATVLLGIKGARSETVVRLSGHHALRIDLCSIDLVRYVVLSQPNQTWTSTRTTDPSVSFSAVLLVLVPLPLARVVVGMHDFAVRRQRKPGHCPGCDYDLTRNVSGVCPECDTKIEGIT